MEADLVLVVGLDDSEHGGREDDEVPDELQPNGQPPEGWERMGAGIQAVAMEMTITVQPNRVTGSSLER